MDDIKKLITSLPEAIWKRIKETLQVSTKAQAIELAEKNPGIADRLRAMLANQGSSEQSALTAPHKEPIPIEDRVYPKNKGRITF
jgi:flagellar basal body-associated protein FliL